MKYKMKMVAPEKSRIKKWFIGTMNGNYVEFKLPIHGIWVNR